MSSIRIFFSVVDSIRAKLCYRTAMQHRDIERVAATASAESGLDDRPRCDPAVLAVAYCGLTLAPCPLTATRLEHGVLWYPSDQPADATAYEIAHETARHLLEYADGCDLAHEQRIASCAAALLLPQRAYMRDLESVGWDLDELAKMWPLAPRWILARRIIELVPITRTTPPPAPTRIARRWAQACGVLRN